MSELDFDRSLPPIMLDHGQWFNGQVARLVEAADGDELAIASSRVEISNDQARANYLAGYTMEIHDGVVNG
ncbi:MAG: hypothetical protein JWN82_6 [Candidatus Saccharibacteria bacterium]|nr:hypothetical protein [Candidatus Saccharibacteria bacterium]